MVMLSTFELLVGAAGDVQELEYISALHQTDVEQVRRDASLQAEDIQLFLSSRYGIHVDQQEVRRTVLSGLLGKQKSGGEEEDAEAGVLDLMELVAALLIPTFLKAAAQMDTTEEADDDCGKEEEIEPMDACTSIEDNNGGADDDVSLPKSRLPDGVVPAPPGMLSYVLKMILHDVSALYYIK